MCAKGTCECWKRGYCEKSCNCNPEICIMRRPGCKCEKGDCKSKNCECYRGLYECEPGICVNCFPIVGKKQVNNCKNNEIFFGYHKKLIISNSQICKGLGAFNVLPIKRNEFITDY